MKIYPKLRQIFESVSCLNLYKPINKARIDFMCLFIAGMIKTRSVHFTEIASAMETEVVSDSNLRRIQGFFSDYKPDYEQIAILLLFLLPEQSDVVELSIDRTNWTFGQVDINFLVITVYSHGIGIPIWFEVLEDKQGGNSNTDERISVLENCIKVLRLLQKQTIILKGDREFIGADWIRYLLKNQVLFYLRLKSNTLVTKNGVTKTVKAWYLEDGEEAMDDVEVFGLQLSIGLETIDGKGDDKYLFVLTNTNGKQACEEYRSRWSIEVFFQSVKTRGFHLEQTHLTEPHKLRKLFALVAIGFTICLNLGIWEDDREPIPVKKHGYKRYSFVRTGINKIREWARLNKTKIWDKFIQHLVFLVFMAKTQLRIT